MRAISSGPILCPNFFIIMDRLYETLDIKKKQWSKMQNKAKGTLFGIGKNKDDLHHLMVERLVVAYDLSAAFWYIHSHG
jgi:plasmid maintenance system antidote protein VapI